MENLPLMIHYHQLTNEVYHGSKCLAPTVVHQLLQEVELHFDPFVTLKWFLSGAEEEHDAAECPAVDTLVSIQLSPSFRCTPLFQACRALYLCFFVVKLYCNIEVNHVYLNMIWFCNY